MNHPQSAREFNSRILNYIHTNSLIKEGDVVILGVSGGADSVCLTLTLRALRTALTAACEIVHVHHGIRGPQADADASFVSELADRLNIPCRIFHVDVPSYADSHHLSVEDAARILRYECFREAVSGKENACIAVAHNLDDQAETVLFRLFRGSGIRGISGMAPLHTDSGIRVIRPLLSTSRAEIESYLSALSEGFRTDETNLLDDYSRNYIRHRLIPVINERFGHAAMERIAMTADILRETGDALDAYADSFPGRSGKGTIRLSDLRQLPSGMRKAVLLRFLEDFFPGRLGLSAAHINALDHLCIQRDGCGLVELPDGITARREYDILTIGLSEAPAVQDDQIYHLTVPSDDSVICRYIPGIGNVYIGRNADSPVVCTVALEYDKIDKGICFRTRRDGDILRISPDGHKAKSLRKLMTDMKVPAARRDGIYMLAFEDDAHVLWIPELKRADRYINAEGRNVDRLVLWIC